MKLFTVEIQKAWPDETGWTVIGKAETLTGGDHEIDEDIARWVAENSQSVAAIEGVWRVVVWNGEYDPTGQHRRDSDAEFYSDMLDNAKGDPS